MDIIRKTLELSSARYRYLITVLESLTLYVISILGYILNIVFNQGSADPSAVSTMRRVAFHPNSDQDDTLYHPAFGAPKFPRNVECQNWFMSLCGELPGIMTHNDVLKFCESINKSPVDIVFLVLAQKMQAKTSGVFTEAEWVTGMTELKINSSAQLVEKWEEIRAEFNDLEMERTVYRFAYDYSRERSRDGNKIEIGTAMELINMFFAGKWKYCKAFLQFLKVSKIQTMTKDQYLNILDFSRSVTSLTFYDETAAWPVLMDEFVEHYKSQPEVYQEKAIFNIDDPDTTPIKFSAQFESGHDWKL